MAPLLYNDSSLDRDAPRTYTYTSGGTHENNKVYGKNYRFPGMGIKKAPKESTTTNIQKKVYDDDDDDYSDS